MDAQLLCSSHLICIYVSQNGSQECPLEFSHRLGILKAASVHLQNDLFELLLHGGTLARELESREKV
jgi:hypothetical protein